MIRVRNSTGLKAIGAIRYRNADNVLNTIKTVKIRNADNVLETVFSPNSGLVIDVPGSAYGGASSNVTAPVTTEIVYATVTGGTAPYTYLWQVVDVYGYSWTIITPTAAATTFRANSVPAGDSRSAIFKCTATDATGAQITSIDINVTADNYGGFA